jgi:D-3-phosphoglycerate dehydrogenase
MEDDGHLALFRYRDQPGMIGRVGSIFGEAGVNISTAAVGRQSQGEDGRRGEVAVMAVMTDGEVPREVVERIADSDGFLEGRAVNL